MKLLRAFIAGLVVPSTILPIGLTLLYVLGKDQVFNPPFFQLLPIIWGLWNVIYFAFLRWVLYIVDLDFRLYITGALLGLLVALIGVFYLDITDKLGLAHNFKYLALVVVPIIYAFLWRYLVKPVNKLLDLKDEA